jgi:S1-C subfamily serine protease
MRGLPRSCLWLWIAAAGLWLLFLAFLGLHLITPSDGARLAPGETQVVAQGLRLEPLIPGAVQPGDLLLAVNGQSVQSLARELTHPAQAGTRLDFGQSVSYTLERAGQRLDLPITLGAYPLVAWSLSHAMNS